MNKTGFGFLRLPLVNPQDETSVDQTALRALVDRFFALGGSYFDTAYTYLHGASEEALRKSVVERYPRGRFRVADKLPGFAAQSAADSSRFFEESLLRCGLTYFDVYLLHGLNQENYETALRFDQFSFLRMLRQEGRVQKIGFSYHDSPQLLDRILMEQPDLDYVQLQINYLDWDSPSIAAGQCYDTALRHGVKVLVMEPVKGGTLSNPPEAVRRLLEQQSPDSPSHWAMRFPTELSQVEVVLSGMNAMEQIEDNLRPMLPLSEKEHTVLRRAAEQIRAQTAIPCTGCGYCLDVCPQSIPIPRYLSLYNESCRHPQELWKFQIAYTSLRKSAPLNCLKCGQCIRKCPQKLAIPDWMPKIAQTLEEDE